MLIKKNVCNVDTKVLKDEINDILESNGVSKEKNDLHDEEEFLNRMVNFTISL